MKLLVKIFLISCVAALAQLFFPWWIVALVCFGMELFKDESPTVSFLSGFNGVGLLWFAYAFYIDRHTNAILSLKMIKLFPIPENHLLLVIIAALIGGITGGFGSLTGIYFRKTFFN